MTATAPLIDNLFGGWRVASPVGQEVRLKGVNDNRQ